LPTYIIMKKIIILSFLIVLNNCSVPGTALLGPVFTGATTKSAARASASYGSNLAKKKFKEFYKEKNKKFISLQE